MPTTCVCVCVSWFACVYGMTHSCVCSGIQNTTCILQGSFAKETYNFEEPITCGVLPSRIAPYPLPVCVCVCVSWRVHSYIHEKMAYSAITDGSTTTICMCVCVRVSWRVHSYIHGNMRYSAITDRSIATTCIKGLLFIVFSIEYGVWGVGCKV